jgi:predicted nucleotidyltransferase
MNRIVANHQKELAALCERFGVRRLEVFGSAAEKAGGRFDPSRSDLDFLVDFAPASPAQMADRYFGLLEELGTLFGRPIDLVMTAAIRNPYFLQGIQPSRTLLYAA